MVKRRKIKAMAARHQRAIGGISLFNEEKKNDESDIGDKTDLNQVGDDKNLQ